MRVICTGTSGTDRVRFLDEVRSLAAQAGRKGGEASHGTKKDPAESPD